ncbi:MAG: PilN domain-containing protein [Sphingopyxis sp.]|nr:PilN domain-containing protein [Sphingopyxis sp.]
MVAFFSDAWIWWLDIVAGLFGNRVQSADGVIVISRDAYSLAMTGDDQKAVFLDASALAERLGQKENGRGRPRSFNITLAHDRFIVRPLAGLSLPDSRHRAMAAIDLAAATPFKAEDMHIFAGTTGAEVFGRDACYIIVKRQILYPVIKALNSAGVQINDLVFQQETGQPRQAVLTPNERRLWVRGTAKRLNRILLQGALAGIVIGGAATFVHGNLVFKNALAKAETNVTELTSEASLVRAAIDERTAMLELINAQRRNIATSRSVTEIWEELAKRLPDSVHLTDIISDRDRVTITGFSMSASQLIAVLEGSALFEKAEFVSPVVKVPGRDGERFVIELKFSPR